MPNHKIAAILSTLLLTTTAYAVDEVTPMGVCKDISIIAKEIMIARQAGKPLSETLPNALAQFGEMQKRYEIEPFEEGNEAITVLVMAAYDIPTYSTEGNQRREISEFENQVFAECYKGMASKSDE